MVCPFPQKLLISHLSLKWPHVSTQGELGPPTTQEKNNKKKRPSQTPPPPKKKKKKKKKKKNKKEKKTREKKKEKKRKKRGNYLCESSLGGLACWRAFIWKRLVRRGLQQQYLWDLRI